MPADNTTNVVILYLFLLENVFIVQMLIKSVYTILKSSKFTMNIWQKLVLSNVWVVFTNFLTIMSL